MGWVRLSRRERTGLRAAFVSFSRRERVGVKGALVPLFRERVDARDAVVPLSPRERVGVRGAVAASNERGSYASERRMRRRFSGAHCALVDSAA